MDELRIGYHCPSSQRVLHALLDAGWVGLIVFDARSWLSDEMCPELMVDAGQPKGPAGALERMRNSYQGEANILAYVEAVKKARVVA